MTSAFAVLGLPPDADERAIKRAYAARLRTTRPDEDPEGFQRLNEAYQIALATVSVRTTAAAAASRSALPPPPAPVEVDETPAAIAPPPPAIDPVVDQVAMPSGDDAFDIDHCLRLAANWDHQPLIAWLDGQASLWSIEGKARWGRMLLLTMAHEQPPVADHNFETLAKCFGYYDLHAGHDFLAVRELRTALHALWREARRSGQQKETQGWSEGNVAELSGASMWRDSKQPPLPAGTRNDWSRLKFDPARKPQPHKEGALGLWVMGTILFLLVLSGLADGRH